MSDRKQIAKYCIDALLNGGAQKAQCALHDNTKHELYVDGGEISLLRTTTSTSVSLTGIVDDRKGSTSISKTDAESLDCAVQSVIEFAKASNPDTANDISAKHSAMTFQAGPEEPDLELMYDRIRSLLDHAHSNYPTLLLNELSLEFVFNNSYFLNSNSVDFVANQGRYDCSICFASKDGKKASSLNYTGFSARDLDRPLHEVGSVDTLLKQSGEQTRTQDLPAKAVGDIIISPDCMGTFIWFIVGMIGNNAMVSGTSIFKDKLNEQIADSQLTLHSRPVSNEISSGYFFTEDGYEAQNSTIIDKGMLRTFLLDLYGAKKTGHPKAVNSGDAYVIDAGSHSYGELVSSVEKGILLGRFSGGYPSANGDFSGVAKNSYYIENGKIQYPLSETMISGNLSVLLKSIKRISRERIDFGEGIFPWIQVSGITISGK